MVSSMPAEISTETAGMLLSIARGREWLVLHGSLLAASAPAANAARRQIEIDADPGFNRGLRAALSRANDDGILAAALSEPDPRLVGLGADARVPHCQAFDASSVRWLEILQAAIVAEPRSMEALDRKRDLFEALILVDAGSAARWKPLWNALASSAAADIWDMPGRRQTWYKIPFELRRQFFAATADGWLAAWQDGRGSEHSVERELEDFITNGERVAPYLMRSGPYRSRSLFLQLIDCGTTVCRLAGEINSRMNGGSRKPMLMLGELIAFRFWRTADTRPEMGRRSATWCLLCSVLRFSACPTRWRFTGGYRKHAGAG
jgi:hypothetical protein